MSKFVSTFKQKTAYWFKRRCGAKLWQPNYYERVLRNDETTSAVARYIFENPVRKGIAKNCVHYPHSGSFEVSDMTQVVTRNM